MRGVAQVVGALVLGSGLGVGTAAAADARPPASVPAIAASAKGRLALLAPATGVRVVLGSASQPAWSPDGRRVAFVSPRNGGSEIYVLDIVTNTLRRLTQSPGTADLNPAWSPDGGRIAWTTDTGDDLDLRVMNADGKGKQILVGGPANDAEPAWDPDGSRVVFASDRGGSFDLWAVSTTTAEQTPLVQLPGEERDPAFSRDGTRLAFSGRAAGNTDVWTSGADGSAPARRTTAARFDGQPTWGPRGGRIAFVSARDGNARIWTMARNGTDQHRLAASRPGDSRPSWASAAVARILPLAGETLPDLDQRAPAGLIVTRLHGHFVLGFDSAVDNIGTGPLWIRGSRPNRRVKTMRADQLVELESGRVRRYRSVGRLRYEAHPPHHHWHFQPFERYELRRASDFALIVRDRKSGFCLADHYGLAAHRVKGFGPPRFLGSCGLGNRRLLRVEQGSSVGYTDRYPALFHGQDVILSGVRAGRYVLVHRANPELTFKELRYDNNAASLLLRISWPGGAGRQPAVEVLKRCPSSERCG
jgi:hypothetical protein